MAIISPVSSSPQARQVAAASGGAARAKGPASPTPGDPSVVNLVGRGSQSADPTPTVHSYPVQFKGTAFGDPAVCGPEFKGTAIGDPARSASGGPEFKGTAIGDPARYGGPEFKGTAIGDPARSAAGSAQLEAASSSQGVAAPQHPVDYVGAAFPDPAVVSTGGRASRAYAAQSSTASAAASLVSKRG